MIRILFRENKIPEDLKGNRMKKENHIYCNCCGKMIHTEIGMQMEEYFYLEKSWGYFSGKDGKTMTADVCETCLDRWIRDFRIAPEMTERTDLFEC